MRCRVAVVGGACGTCCMATRLPLAVRLSLSTDMATVYSVSCTAGAPSAITTPMSPRLYTAIDPCCDTNLSCDTTKM